MAPIILGCLAAVLLVLRVGMVSKVMVRGLVARREKVGEQIAPTPIPKTSQASQESSAQSGLLGKETNVLFWACPPRGPEGLHTATAERGWREACMCLGEGDAMVWS